MTPETVTTIGQQALWVTMLIAAPLLLSALAVGLLVGMFQAATQINEQTMSFLPRLIVTVLMIMVAGPGMAKMVLQFTDKLITSIPYVIG